MAFKNCHQLLNNLQPKILIGVNENFYQSYKPYFNKFGFREQIFRSGLNLNDENIHLSFFHTESGLIPEVVVKLSKPLILTGEMPLKEEMERYDFPIVYFPKELSLDHEKMNYLLGRVWSQGVEKFKSDLEEHWEYVKKKSFKEYNKLLKNIDVNEDEKNNFWPEIQKISKRFLKFLGDHVDSSRIFSTAIEKYLEDHPELECIYKGPLFGNNDDIKKAKSSADYIFLLESENGPVLLIFEKKKKILYPEILDQELSILADLIFLFERDVIIPWAKIFNHIPVPFAVYDSDGDIHIHNREFAKVDLGTNEIQKAKAEDLIEKSGQTIKISKTQLNTSQGLFNLLTFLSIDNLVQLGHDSPKKDNVKDLGIIAGSLAHELNNPIAGILTALTFLENDLGINKETLQEIEEIKKCALRCKELIQIFLGLSRINIGQESRLNLEEIIEQSLSLLRFRMVESGITIDLKKRVENFQSKIFNIENSSVLSMVIYLLLNTIINDIGHRNLLNVTGKHEHVHFSTEWEYSYEKIIFYINNPPKLEAFVDNKLFLHLLDLCKLKIVIGIGHIELAKN